VHSARCTVPVLVRPCTVHGAAVRGAVVHGAVVHGAAVRGAVVHGAAVHGAAVHGAVVPGAVVRGAIRAVSAIWRCRGGCRFCSPVRPVRWISEQSGLLSGGIGRAIPDRVAAARHHRELEAWQLADSVRQAMFELVGREPVRRDYDFCGQTRRSASSACRNTAEGFWRYGHAEFAHFVKIARGSLGELLDSTDEALEKRYILKPEYDALNQLVDRALRANAELLESLQTTPTPPRRKRRQDRSPPKPLAGARPSPEDGPDAVAPDTSSRSPPKD